MAENEEESKKEYPWSLNPVGIDEDEFYVYPYPFLNIKCTKAEREQLEEETKKKAVKLEFSNVQGFGLKKFFGKAYLYVYPKNEKEKPQKFSFRLRGERLGTNLGSVLIDIAFDKLKTALRMYEIRHPETVEKSK